MQTSQIKWKDVGIVLAVVVLCQVSVFVRAQLPITEKIEWTWSDCPESPLASLPNVLLVGDSITRAYYPAVSSQLNGVANVYLFATSACSGQKVLDISRLWV